MRETANGHTLLPVMTASRSRAGTTLIETVVACTLLASVMLTIVPAVVRCGRLRQQSHYHRLALGELTNQMELLTALPQDQLPELMDDLQLSPAARQSLPDPELGGLIAQTQDGSQLTLRLRWNVPGRRERPLVLTTWVYPREDPGRTRGDAARLSQEPTEE
jgi:hypothetical protein